MGRDFQRSRVYRWEQTCVWPQDRVRPNTLSLEECARLVERAYPHTTLIPTVSDGRGRRRGGGSKYKIKLPRWTRFPAYVLHECAHGTKPREDEAHGPEFVATLIELLVALEGYDLTQLLRSARTSGVKVARRNYHAWEVAAGPDPS